MIGFLIIVWFQL